MRSVALVSLFLGVSHLCSAASTERAEVNRLTVVVNFEKPHSAVSVAALERELKDLLEPAGVTVDLLLQSEAQNHSDFGEMVVFDMKGSCSMIASPLPMGALSDERGPLAMAYSSDGQILHFGEVECDRVRRCLQRITGRGNPEKHQAAYGAALGVVMAHELYHMICGAKAHTKDGLTKESLSARELLNGELAIPGGVRDALRRGVSPHP